MLRSDRPVGPRPGSSEDFEDALRAKPPAPHREATVRAKPPGSVGDEVQRAQAPTSASVPPPPPPLKSEGALRFWEQARQDWQAAEPQVRGALFDFGATAEAPPEAEPISALAALEAESTASWEDLARQREQLRTLARSALFDYSQGDR